MGLVELKMLATGKQIRNVENAFYNNNKKPKKVFYIFSFYMYNRPYFVPLWWPICSWTNMRSVLLVRRQPPLVDLLQKITNMLQKIDYVHVLQFTVYFSKTMKSGNVSKERMKCKKFGDAGSRTRSLSYAKRTLFL